jgi:CRISPR/Cas system-associated exonuclease Cas4 (RecB family)
MRASGPLFISRSTAMPQRLSHLSPSSIGTYLKCPRQFWFRYIERLEPAFRPVALAFGSAFHETIAQWLLACASGQRVSPEALHELFRRAMGDELRRDGPPILFDDEETEDDLVARGKHMLDAFARAVRPPERVVGVEVPFELELVDPETGEVLPPLVGAVDAVIENGATELWELKTAARRWSDDALSFNLQATAYWRGMRDVYPGAQVRLLVVTKTRSPDVQLEHLVRGPSDERDLIATAVGVSRAVEAGVDHPLRSWACKSCPYAGACL